MKNIVTFSFIVTVVFLMITCLSAQSPDTAWTRTYGGTFDDYGMSVQQTSDDGYIIVGWTESFGAGNVDVYLIKTNASGDTLWSKTYGGIHEDGGNSVQQTLDGGYIIAGHTYSFGAGMFDVYLIKTDADGDTMWTKTYGGYLYDQGWSVKETSDSGYIVVGFTASFGDPLYDVYLIKTDVNGNTIWTKTYGTTLSDWCNSVQETSDSGYILAGYTGYYSNYDMYLIKTNKNGDLLWTKTYGGMRDDYAWTVQQTSDGGYIIVGWTESYGAGDTDIYLVKTDENGDSIWAKTFGGSDEDKALWVQEIPGDGYIIAGSTFSYGAGGADVYLIRTNSNGDTVWTKTYGGTAWDRANTGQVTSDGGYVVAGFTSSFGAGNADIWLLKTEPDPTNIQEKIIKKPNSALTNITIFPNPFRKTLRIEGISKVKVYNISGKFVAEVKDSWNGKNAKGHELKPGIYLLQSNGRNVGKVVKLR